MANVVDLTIRKDNGTTVTVPHAFTYDDLPTITAITPTHGMAGTAVTITGTQLTGTVEVRFGSTPATSVAVVNDTTVTCVAPAVAA